MVVWSSFMEMRDFKVDWELNIFGVEGQWE